MRRVFHLEDGQFTSSFLAQRLEFRSELEEETVRGAGKAHAHSTCHPSDRRSTVLARNKRDFVAATEIPAISAISLMGVSCTC
jgi:hypothetical protein